MALNKELSNITIKIDNFLQIENMDVNNLNIYIGQNGSGKSVVLKMNWLFAMLNSIILANKEIPNTPTDFVVSSFDYFFNNTFPENDWTGILEYQLNSGESAQAKLENGKIVSIVDFNYNDSSERLGTVYMSKDTRTFDSLDHMLNLRKMLLKEAKEEDIFNINPAVTHEMSKQYKFHDVQLLEIYLYKCNSYTYSEEEIEMFATKFNINNIHRLYIDPDSNKFKIEFVEKKDDGTNKINIKSASLLSAGEQSIINMFTVSAIMSNKNNN